MVTPFDLAGEVNFEEARRIARYLVDDQKNDGLIVSGTTGESPTLSASEKIELLKVVLDEVGDRAAVIFGAGTYNTRETIELTEAGESAGAHGIMLVNPYYSKPGQEGLYAHFSTCARATSLPVLLYNIQPRSAINLETETLLKLAEIENIVGVKEASGNIPQISAVAAQVPDGFRVYSGDDNLTLPILSVGGHGVVSVAGHLVGRQIKDMIEAFPTDFAKALRIHRALAGPIAACFFAPNPVPVKFGLSVAKGGVESDDWVSPGFACEDVRLPLVGLSETQKERFFDLFWSTMN